LLCLILFLLIQKIVLAKKIYKLLSLFIFAFGLIINLIFAGFLELKGFTDCTEIEFMELMLIYLVMIKMSVNDFLDSVFLFFIILVPRIVGICQAPNPSYFQNIVLIMFCCILLLQSHSRMSKLVKNFNNLNITHYRQNQQKNLFMHLLPKHVNFICFLFYPSHFFNVFWYFFLFTRYVNGF